MSAAASAKLKLQYFPGRGRAEISRIMLAEKKVAYDDVRIPSADWPKHKASAPFGQMPLLFVGSHVIAQSAAIERYVARTTGLYGKDDSEAAAIDMVVEGVKDAVTPFITAAYTKDETEKKTKLEAYFKNDFSRWGGQLTALLKANDSGKGYFVGTDVTYADVYFYVAIDAIAQANATALKEFPELSALLTRVAARPNIAAWLKSRPVSPF
jgi:glutathione S-transferase